MRQQVPKSLTVLVDNREKTPVIFPENFRWHRGGQAHLIPVRTRSVRLPTGDYALAGFEDWVLVERKGSMKELHTNFCTRDVIRFTACLKRLKEECELPILYLDFPTATTFRPDRYVPNPELVLDRLFGKALDIGAWVLWTSMPNTMADPAVAKTAITPEQIKEAEELLQEAARRSGEFLVRAMWTATHRLLQR